jgi:diketogulonate reductase-like aldo/keto reductase
MKDGNRIPAVGLGTWSLKGAECRRVVKMALKLGYRHIDTAELYGNEMDIGAAIKDFDRSKIFVTSKVRGENLRYDDAIEACNRSLDELGTEYIDLYLIHWPVEEVPLEETLKAFRKLLTEGKIKSAGVSNFDKNLLETALKMADFPIAANQVEFHPYRYRKNLLDFCKDSGLVVTAYSPLGVGRLLQDSAINEVAARYNRTAAQVCLRWSLQKGVVVIPKASSGEHLKDNLDIYGWSLMGEDVNKLDSLTKDKRAGKRGK